MIDRVARMLFVAAVFTVACAGNWQPPGPPTRQSIADRSIGWMHDTIPLLRYSPFFIYGMWRLQVEQCSGLTREGWPRFFVAPVHPIPGGPTGRLGFFDPAADVIVVSLSSPTNQMVIMHELLHWLTEPLVPERRDGETEDETLARVHPAEFYGDSIQPGRCGPLVHPR